MSERQPLITKEVAQRTVEIFEEMRQAAIKTNLRDLQVLCNREPPILPGSPPVHLEVLSQSAVRIFVAMGMSLESAKRAVSLAVLGTIHY